MQQCPLLLCTQGMCYLTFFICITRCLNGNTYRSLMHSSVSNANSKTKYSFPSSGRNALLMCTRENLPLYLHIVFVQVSCAMIKGHGQRHLKIKVLILSYSSQITLNSWGKLDRDVEEGTKAEAMKECCSMACSFCFLTDPRTTSVGMALHIMVWTLLRLLSTKKMPHRLT